MVLVLELCHDNLANVVLTLDRNHIVAVILVRYKSGDCLEDVARVQINEIMGHSVE